MAGICLEYNGQSNAKLLSFACDSTEEIKYLPTTTDPGTDIFADYDYPIPIGSTCTVGNEGGNLLVYMLFSFGWKALNS